MPEAFKNVYTFASRGAIPSIDELRQRLEHALATQFSIQSGAAERGAPRDWSKLYDESTEVWIFWEAGRPVIELLIPEPIERMFAVNAAMEALGATPEHDDHEWRRRITARRQARIARQGAAAAAAAVAAGMVWFWGWWGFLAVVLLAIAGSVTWTLGLASAFRRP